MIIARILGTVVSTQKDERLQGKKLLIVKPINLDGTDQSGYIVAVDTVGAGDAFTAAVVIDFLAGLPLAEINAHANAVASFVCSQPGAVAALPDYLRNAPLARPN